MKLFAPTPALEDLLDYDHIPVPYGTRVRSVRIIEEGGVETISIDLEAIPEPPRLVIGQLSVQR